MKSVKLLYGMIVETGSANGPQENPKADQSNMNSTIDSLFLHLSPGLPMPKPLARPSFNPYPKPLTLRYNLIRWTEFLSRLPAQLERRRNRWRPNSITIFSSGVPLSNPRLLLLNGSKNGNRFSIFFCFHYLSVPVLLVLSVF